MGLWEAVIIMPMVDRVQRDLKAARMPVLNAVESRRDASVRKPAVPYEKWKPAGTGNFTAAFKRRALSSSIARKSNRREYRSSLQSREEHTH